MMSTLVMDKMDDDDDDGDDDGEGGDGAVVNEHKENHSTRYL